MEEEKKNVTNQEIITDNKVEEQIKKQKRRQLISYIGFAIVIMSLCFLTAALGENKGFREGQLNYQGLVEQTLVQECTLSQTHAQVIQSTNSQMENMLNLTESHKSISCGPDGEMVNMYTHSPGAVING